MSDREGVTPVGESDIFLKFNDELSGAAKVDRSILLIGERGTGKELAARKLHYLSKRWENPLITVNCAALPPSLIETELFGHEKGAFTGANASHKGRFEEAEGGTLFLDEIGLIPLEVQEKILRVVEYGTFSKVGASEDISVNVRIIGATNADMKQLVREGKFKEDLLDRLSFEVLFLPPLRERGEDIMHLASYFASRMAAECGKDGFASFSNDIIDELNSYDWPGNVRELKNVVERAVYRSKTDEICEIELDPFQNPYEKKIKEEQQVIEEDLKDDPLSIKLDCEDLSSFNDSRQKIEITYLRCALEKSGNNQRESAALLGLSYDQFRGLFRKYKKEL
jgi:psp operon transcriptional activator